MNNREQGFVLAVALVFLIVITLLVVSALRYSSASLKVSGNDELTVSAFEQTQSIVDAVYGDETNMPVTNNPNEVYCTPGQTGCTQTTVALPSGMYNSSDVSSGKISARVSRLSPAFRPPPLGYSSRCFQSAQFNIEGTYDKTDEGKGRMTINQGAGVVVQTGPC